MRFVAIYKTLFIKQLASLLVLVLLANCLHAQLKEMRFRYLTTADGLSSNIITCIEQDKYGFIWIGTEQGLNRYNGYEVKIFNKKLNQHTSIADNTIMDIHIDDDKNIWIGTQNGICLYNEDSETFKTTILNPKQKTINTANSVTKINEDSKKNLIASVEAGYLYYYNKETKKFEADTTFLGSIRDFAVDERDNIWLGGDNGVTMYNPSTGYIKKYEFYNDKGKDIIIPQVNSIYQEGDTIWIGAILGKVFYILKSQMTIHSLDVSFPDSYYVSDIYKTSEGLIYISTTNGLHAYNKKTNKITSYIYSKGDGQGINAYGTRLVYEDRQGNKWIGTTQGGVNIAIKGKPFRNYNLHSKDLTLDQINIKSIFEDNKGNLWIGSFDKGLNKINPKTNKRQFFEHDPLNLNSLGFGTVNFLFQDSKQKIWLGTYTGQLQQYNPLHENFINYGFNAGTLKKPIWVRDIRSMVEDDEGNLWMVAHANGLLKFNPETKDYKFLKQDFLNTSKSLADNWAFYMIKGSDGYFWVATPSGLSRLNPKTEEFKNFYKTDIDTLGLCDNFINTLFDDSNNNLWIGTNFGLSLFDRDKNIFHHFFEKDGLSSNKVVGILEHKPGELWISTAHGLSRLIYNYNKKSGIVTTIFRNYTKYDNLQDDFFWINASCKLKNGRLAFGGEKGIVVFNPDDIKENSKIPDVYIIDFKLFNKTVQLGEYDSVLTKNIINTKEIKLDYNQNYIAFNFVAMNFIAQEKNMFKYMLEGFDKEWVVAVNKREASYTNLDPGEYIFKVKASNNDNVWNEKGAIIKIIIKPPFWATPAFIALSILLMISIIALYLYSRFKQFNQQRVYLEQKVKERTIDLEELNEELTVKNTHIIEQNNEIKLQAEEISAKGNKILTQNEKLEEQKNEIEKAYEELKTYRNELENLVDNRTKELIKAKEKAEESDRLKTSFLTNMSHEIRTPLNSILGFSGLLLDDNIEKEIKKRYKHIIDINSRLLLGLINDIIDFSKIEASQIEIKYADVNVKNLFDDVKEIYDMENYKILSQKKHDVDFIINAENCPDELHFLSDEFRIKQILTILINNALKFTEKGFVEVGCYLTDNSFINFYVKDTGIGIDKKYHDIIFNRFRKIEEDLNTLYRGAGLGLSISKHLSKLLGGKIWIDSELNKGSVFTFSIPLIENARILVEKLQKTVKIDKIPDLNNKTILVAEDDESNYFFLERLLLKTNATLIHALNGQKVIEEVTKNNNIDLILMDIKMPEMNGIQALIELKNRNYNIPSIAQTAYAFADEIHRIKEAGFADYISKPINPRKLFKLIKKSIL